jgi:large subunit ribosomal protein L7/L12
MAKTPTRIGRPAPGPARPTRLQARPIPREPEPALFAVVLLDAGYNKLNVVKIVKTLTGLGLKEAKDLVDKPGSVIRDQLTSSEAEAVKAQLVEAGATVEIRGPAS